VLPHAIIIFFTQGLRSREEEDKVSSYFLLKVCYTSLDALHLYVPNGNMDQVEHHVFIINKYKQPVLSMWSIRIGPNLLIMDILLVLTLRGHHVVGDSRYLQSICNHSARHSRIWNSRRKCGIIWWRSRAPASYKWANLHESLSFCWYTLAFRVAMFFMLEFLVFHSWINMSFVLWVLVFLQLFFEPYHSCSM